VIGMVQLEGGYHRSMTIRLAVLGDSIALGQGAASSEDTPASRLTAALADRGLEATSRVYAVSGARSCALRSQVARATRWEPDVAVIVIGANDLSHRTPPELAAEDLRAAVRRLRAVGAEVVVAPAPDLSTVPYVPEALRHAVRAASARLRAGQVAVTTAEGGRVADAQGSTSLAFAADPTLFSADRFHPSSAGYAVITEALLPHVVDAAERLAAQSERSRP
jgi:lysophospholipase L1-like esterase